jgi:hypothetical protein
MPENNMDGFNKCAALIFDLLYKNFPIETDIIVDNLAQHIDEESRDDYFATIRFLERERFIRYKTAVYGGFIGAVLTAKGLAILNITPDAIKEKGTIAKRISNALKTGSTEAVRVAIQQAIKASVSGLL